MTKPVNIQKLESALLPHSIVTELNTITGSINFNALESKCIMLISASSLKDGYQVDYISTAKAERRQGLATALYKLVYNLLKAQGIQLYHPNSKTPQGVKWALSLEY